VVFLLVGHTATRTRYAVAGATRDVAVAPSVNNVVAASARLRRAPEYTAPKTRGLVNDLVEVGRCMAEGRSCWRRVGNL
ncbi:MAG: hypothetical protein ABMA15_30350, partial [Vicinamibacterales bacterium]